MKHKIILNIFWSLCLFMISCSENDDNLPSHDFTPCRFIFPQGTSAADQEIEKIHTNTKSYIIYKDITSTDLNRNWIDPESTSFVGILIKEPDVSFYLTFLNDNLLKYIKNEYLQRSLPVYFYLLEHLESTKGGGDTVLDLKTDGLDFWALGLSVEEIEQLSMQGLKRLRSRMIYPAIKTLISKKIVTVPEKFYKNINYETALKNSPTTTTGGEEANYYRCRGFVDFVDETNFFKTNIPTISMVKAVCADLLSYVRVALYYSEEAFQKEYPSNVYPLINERYSIITSYLKSTYDIDLKAIARDK